MIGWGVLLVVRSPLHGVIDLSWCGLLRRLGGSLLHFSFLLEENGAIFGAIVDFATMVHAVRRFERVRASVVTSTTIWCSASLSVLRESLIRSSQVSFLPGCSEILLPIFWWSTVIRIDVVYWFGVASLIFIVARSWSFIGLWHFPLLLELTKMLNFRFAEFRELFIGL
jgi:hypothetical protein